MAEADQVELIIKQSSGDSFNVTIAKSATVLELKEKCKEKTQLEATAMRLIYKGKPTRLQLLACQGEEFRVFARKILVKSFLSFCRILNTLFSRRKNLEGRAVTQRKLYRKRTDDSSCQE